MKALFSPIIAISLFLSGCTGLFKKDEDVNPCVDLATTLVGTYEITITEYPLQTTTEGWKADVLVFVQPNRCFSPSDTTKIDRILFNGLFNGFGSYFCSSHTLVNDNSFDISYSDNVDWAGGPIRGHGTIINEVFHFEGEVENSTGDHRIVLDGFKKKQDRRTDAC